VYQYFSSNTTVTYPTMNEYTYFPCGTRTPFQFMVSPYGAPWSHALDTSQSPGRLISPTQRPPPDTTQHSQGINNYAPVGFEPTIPASEQRQTHAL